MRAISIAFGITLVIGLLIALQSLPVETSAAPGGARIPAAIAGHRMLDLHGKTHTLLAYRGHAVVLNVWATWCPPCRRETPRLERAYQRYRKRGVIVLGVDQNDSSAAVRAFVSRFRLQYPVVLDPQEVFGAAVNFGFPTTVFVDRNGSVRSVHHGEITTARLQRQIESLLGS